MSKLILNHYGDPVTICEYRGLPNWRGISLQAVEKDLRVIMANRTKAPGYYRVFVEYHMIEWDVTYREVWIQQECELYRGPNLEQIGFVRIGEEKDDIS